VSSAARDLRLLLLLPLLWRSLGLKILRRETDAACTLGLDEPLIVADPEILKGLEETVYLPVVICRKRT